MSQESPQPEKQNALVGRTLQDNYYIERLVGKGGMAWVFRSTHLKLKEAMAVKILLPHISDDPEIRSRFLDEARIQFKLKHPNIVQVTDVLEDASLIGIVMEWVEGENLKQMLRRLEAPASRKDIWRIMAPVLDAVGFAHTRGLVHRDIKPANILLHREGEQMVPKVADFGIAKILNEAEEGKTATGMTMGTVKYMSPEQIRDSKNVDHRADIYSLGVTLYGMATGRLPFSGRQEWVMYQQMHEDPPPPSSFNPAIGPAMDKVVLKCMAKDPKDRFQSCAEMAHSLSLSLLDSANNERNLPPGSNPAEIYRLLMDLPEENSIYSSTVNPLPAVAIAPIIAGQAPPGTDPNIPKPGVPAAQADATTLDAPKMPHEFTSAGTIPPIGQKGIPWLLLIGSLVIFLSIGIGAGLYLKNRRKHGLSLPSDAGIAVATPDAGTGSSASPGSKGPVIPKTCVEGATLPCFDGPRTQRGKGECKAGRRTCKGGKYGACEAQTLASAEVCNNKDDDCDGQVDEGFANKGQACQVKIASCTFQGTWQCSAKTKALVCVKSATQPPSNTRRIQFELRPKWKRFSLTYRGRRRRVRGSYCVEGKRAIRITLKTKRYHRCTVTLVSRSRPYVLRMKKMRSGELDPPLKYCK